ncbi:MAG TPA: PQQ-binding-like beta-propeller repeat protein, partial [Candidatus Saccharimonadales bacterium]|nr:PQQ-binding-like beta-propeller repeat protein [Candidatus Saccharimonadales bacterium]
MKKISTLQLAKSTAFVSSIIASLLVPPTFASDWPQWGGLNPGRNMYSPEKGLPSRFEPGQLKPGTEEVDMKTTKNVKWVVKLGSQSYGNATVANGRVYVGTNNDTPRNKKHGGDRSILMCFDEKTGEFLWQLVVPKLAAGKVNDWENLGLFSSPNVDGDNVYLVTSRCEVLCLDAKGMKDGNNGPFKDEGKYVVKDVVIDKGKPTEHPAPPIEPGPTDADIVWRYDMLDELGVFPHNASNCSTLIVDDILYTSTSNGQDWTHSNVPSPSSPSLIAINKKTGELLAEDDAKIGPHIFHGLWSSPSTGKVNGKQLIFFGGGDGLCYAFDAKPVKEGDTSYLKTVWKFDCNPPEYKKAKYPDANGPSEVIATPVFYKDRIYVSIGQDPEHGEGIGRIVCLDAKKTGDITQSGLIWENRDIHRTMASVSIDPSNGLLFVNDFSGFVHCMDAETGKVYWTHDMKAHMWGSTLVADGKVYVGDEDGDL